MMQGRKATEKQADDRQQFLKRVRAGMQSAIVAKHQYLWRVYRDIQGPNARRPTQLSEDGLS